MEEQLQIFDQGLTGCVILSFAKRDLLPIKTIYLVGKHSMKKDDYLMTIMQVPPKQRIAITPFDSRTQREAFSVSLDGLKGVRIST